MEAARAHGGQSGAAWGRAEQQGSRRPPHVTRTRLAAPGPRWPWRLPGRVCYAADPRIPAWGQTGPGWRGPGGEWHQRAEGTQALAALFSTALAAGSACNLASPSRAWWPRGKAAPTLLPRAGGHPRSTHSLCRAGAAAQGAHEAARGSGPSQRPRHLEDARQTAADPGPGATPIPEGQGLRPGAGPRWGPWRGADPNSHSLAPERSGPALSGPLPPAGRCLLPWLLWRCTRGHLAWLSGERTHVSQEASWLQRPGKFQVQLLPLPSIPARLPTHAPPKAVPGVCGQRLPGLAWPCRSLGAVTAAPARRPRSPRGPGAPPHTTCWSGSSSGCARGAGPPASACG